MKAIYRFLYFCGIISVLHFADMILIMIPRFLKKRFSKASSATPADSSVATKATTHHAKDADQVADIYADDDKLASTSYSKAPISQIYRKLSGKALGVTVKPKLLGELPKLANDEQTLTFYVLQDYSRSNSILIDLQTGEYQLPPALVGVKDLAHDIDENAAIIFLNHPKATDDQLSPRLARLVAATLQHPDLNIRLVPVSILWGLISVTTVSSA